MAKWLVVILVVIACSTVHSTQNVLKLNSYPDQQFYTVPIYIGTPAQVFEVQVDTTTSETWVPSINTTRPITVKYDGAKSKTATVTNKTIELDDEEGDVSGKATFDNIKVGEYEFDNFGFVQVVNYDIETFTDYQNGKLGFGFKQERGEAFDFVQMLKYKKLIDKEMFTIVPKSKELVIGELPQQYKDVKMSSCNLTETDDLDDDYRPGWVCELTHVFLYQNYNSSDKAYSIDNAHEVESRVIFDSAYNYISLPKQFLSLIKDNLIKPIFNDTCYEVRASHEKYFICEYNQDKLAKVAVTFVIGGYGYVLRASELFVKTTEGTVELLMRFKEENDNIWALGLPFLNSFTTVYDYELKKVGFFEGERIDMENEWNMWMNGETPKQKQERIRSLIVAASVIGGILLLIVICLIVRSCKKQKLHGPEL